MMVLLAGWPLPIPAGCPLGPSLSPLGLLCGPVAHEEAGAGLKCSRTGSLPPRSPPQAGAEPFLSCRHSTLSRHSLDREHIPGDCGDSDFAALPESGNHALMWHEGLRVTTWRRGMAGPPAVRKRLSWCYFPQNASAPDEDRRACGSVPTLPPSGTMLIPFGVKLD